MLSLRPSQFAAMLCTCSKQRRTQHIRGIPQLRTTGWQYSEGVPDVTLAATESFALDPQFIPADPEAFKRDLSHTKVRLIDVKILYLKRTP